MPYGLVLVTIAKHPILNRRDLIILGSKLGIQKIVKYLFYRYSTQTPEQ